MTYTKYSLINKGVLSKWGDKLAYNDAVDMGVGRWKCRTLYKVILTQ